MACNTGNGRDEAPVSCEDMRARIAFLEGQLQAKKAMEMVTFRMEVEMLERIDALIPLYRRAYPSRREASRSQMMRDFMEYGVDLLEKRLMGDGSG